MATREDIQARKKMCYDGWFYSAQRIDLLIITIDGAGIYVVLETLKFSLDQGFNSLCLLKVAGVLFVLSIIVNFISQFTGRDANYYDMLHCDGKLCADEPPTAEQQEAILKHDRKADFYTKLTGSFNLTSMVVMFLALAILIIFFLITF